ncbi:hypothetical protein LCGC14_1995460 [marine sediment metagenome]|uniref:Uncharacterized protein n=1 Tax=marine sediment metagenome TaxID=412755 RepID=A0A0F9F526_9ZZZZ
MKDLAYHWIVGNDTPPWIVAAARGLLTALLAAATNFFMVWSQTDDVKLLISGPSGVFLSVLTLRLAAEGIIDSWKNGKP